MFMVSNQDERHYATIDTLHEMFLSVYDNCNATVDETYIRADSLLTAMRCVGGVWRTLFCVLIRYLFFR